MIIDPHEIKKDFPIFNRLIHGKPLIFLDNAASTQCPGVVIEAINNFYTEHNANIHRAVYLLSYEATQMYEEAHKTVACFIGAESWREIIFTRNATEALNLIAYAWGYQNIVPGDEILITLMEHHSNIVPWQFIAKLKNAVLKYVNVTVQGKLDLEDYYKQLTDKVKLVSIIHASNVLGCINPVQEMIAAAKKIGARTIVDAAQSVPHFAVKVKDIGCDFIVASGHKMLAPTGIGFLYGKMRALEGMVPFLYGGDMIGKVTKESSTWNELPWKFEAGTPNIAGGIGLHTAINYLNKLGMENIAQYENQLTKYAIDKIKTIPNIELHGPMDASDRLGVISFNIKDVPPHDAASVLDSNGIAVRSGNHCAQPLMSHLKMENAVRASMYIYNTFEDINKLVDVLIKVNNIFHRK